MRRKQKRTMKKLQTRKSQTSQRFQRLIFSTARPTGSIGQEHNLQKKTSSKHGPAFEYHITKCHIIANKNPIENATEIFQHKDFNILEGHRVPGSIIGSASACHNPKTKIASERAKKLSFRNFRNHFETLTARQNSHSECISSIY